MRDGERQFRLLVGVTDYALYMLDPNGLVASWNAGARRIKGYSDEDIIGQHFSKFYFDGDRAAGLPAERLPPQRKRGAMKRRAGAYARTARSSGPAW